MEYTVIIYKAEEGGYWAKVPYLPGCYSQGETPDEILTNIKEAIESHIMALQEDGQEIPQEKSVISGRVEVKVGSQAI
jgi:predicted RNase H-like HicB family nuclease